MSLRRVAFIVAGTAVLAVPSSGAAPAAADFPGGSYFAVVCGFSHRNNDDPIAFPGQPGRSHNHTYLGNRNVHAFTTPASLRGGETTCEIPGDASTYWTPTLFIGSEPVPPLAGVVYYVKQTDERVVPFPQGLKMIAGNQNATKAQPKHIVAWSCNGIGGKPRYAALPSCDEDHAVELRVHFPNCWNGKTTDSPDHKRHMAYATRGQCPESHPVAVPTLAVIMIYPAVPAVRAALASGKFGGHADFINGWDPDDLALLVSGLNFG